MHPSYHTTNSLPLRRESVQMMRAQTVQQIVEQASDSEEFEDMKGRLEGRIIYAIMQYINYAVDHDKYQSECRFCGRSMHCGITSRGEPYTGCKQCKTLFLIKPAILHDLFGYESRIIALVELMTTESITCESAVSAMKVIGNFKDIIGRRQRREAYLIYSTPQDEFQNS